MMKDDGDAPLKVWFPTFKRSAVRSLALPKEQLSNVLDEIETATREFWRAWECEMKIQNLEVDEDWKISWTRRSYASRGRPPKLALYAYIRTLVLIYERATGKVIKRSVSNKVKWRRVISVAERKTYNKKEKEHIEKPIPFLLACLKAARVCSMSGSNYPRHIIKPVLQELHSEKPAS
jgi:hypothetical protein